MCHLECHFYGTIRACGSCLLESNSWTLLRLHSPDLRADYLLHQDLECVRMLWLTLAHVRENQDWR